MPVSWFPRLIFENTSTIAVLLALFGLHYSAILGDDVRTIVFKEPIVNKFFADHVISKKVVTSEGSCRVKCYMESNCVSVNLGALAGGKLSCELNNATAEHQSASQLMTEVGYTYLAIENPCISNPCHSGNKCQAGFTSKGFRCLPANSCSEIKKLNASVESGIYVIDPDGGESLPAFNVTCNMTDQNGIGVTVISHDSENRTLVDGFENSGTYTRDVNYTGATLLQLGSLTKVSSHCEQSIRYECYSSKLNKEHKPDEPVGWWLSRDSAMMTYWDGASGNATCACANRNNCAGNAGCNCDENDFTWREDSGLLTNKSDLPVTQLRFGDTGVDENNNVSEKGYHTLGKFRCFGIA